jgi:hypothetical protein
MQYAKVKLNEVIEFPYTWNSLNDENPYTNFDDRFDLVGWYAQTEDALNRGSEIVVVVQQPEPSINWNTHSFFKESTPTLTNKGWVLSWVIVEKTPEQIAASQASQN